MHHFNYLLLFLSRFHLASTLTFSEPSSLLSNATQTPLSNLTSSSILPNAVLQCDLPDTAPPLDEDDCYGALGLLPTDSEHARFHRGSGRQSYKLPLSVSQGNCRIKVDLIDHVTEEESTWDEVFDGAQSLISDCVETLDGLGGNFLVGDNDLIRVTIRYTVGEAAGRSNGSTILSSRSSSLSPLSRSVPRCYPRGTGNAPEPLDCLVIQDWLPIFPLDSTFHRAGAIDGYRLPVINHEQTCEISITLVDAVQEEKSSWRSVSVAAALLIARCVLEEAHPGGEILVGERDHIRVTVNYFSPEPRGNNNSTILSSRTLSSPRLNQSVPHCYPPGTGDPPDPDDCVSALNPMPESSTDGTFHKGGADDGHRLPVRYNHQTCDIIIEFVDDVQEENSTWLTVAWETWGLIFMCVIEGVNLGGDVLVGERNLIRVIVKYSIQEAEGTITAGDVE